MPLDEAKIHSLSSSADIPLGEREPLYIIFIDMCDSTEFKTYCLDGNIPDGIWIERQVIFLHRAIGNIQRFGGAIVKTIGDEVMGYFNRTTPAKNVLKCGTDSHSLFRAIARYDKENWRILSRVSIDYGEVYDSNFGLLKPNTIDPIGLAVDRCARLNKEGNSGEVVFSSSVFALLDSKSQEKYSPSMEKKELSGIGPSEFYRILVT